MKKKWVFAHMVREFKSKVAVVGRAVLSCNNPMLTAPEGNEIIAKMLVLISIFSVVVINIINIFIIIIIIVVVVVIVGLRIVFVQLKYFFSWKIKGVEKIHPPQKKTIKMSEGRKGKNVRTHGPRI